MKRAEARSRLAQQQDHEGQKPGEHPGVAIQKGGERYELTAETRVTPMPRLCTLAGTTMRCLSTVRRESVLTEVDSASACILRRTAGLPLIHRLWSNSAGYSLGYTRTEPIGNPSQLYFLHPGGTVLRERVLPDAASEIVEGTGRWVAACRNDWIYAYSVEGEQLWQWRMPPDQFGDYWDGPGPDRLRVAAMGLSTAVAYGERLWFLTGEGQTMWEYSLPKPDYYGPAVVGEMATRAQAHDRLISVFGGEVRLARTAQLRFSVTAAGEEPVPARLNFQQHPAVLEDDETGELASATPHSFIPIYRPPQKITALGVCRRFVIAGTAAGELHFFDSMATLQKRFYVGKARVFPMLVDQTGLKVTCSGGLLTLFEDGAISGCVELTDGPLSLAGCGSSVLAWRGQTAWLINPRGHVLWRAEFRRPIRSVVSDATGFHVLAGAIYSFRAIPEARRVDQLKGSENQDGELHSCGDRAISGDAEEVNKENTTAMKIFTIHADHRVTVYGSRAEAEASGVSAADMFESEEQLAHLVGNWPGARLVEVWNGLPGVRPVRRFTNRKMAAERIWRAVQSLDPSPASRPARRKANGASKGKTGREGNGAEHGSKRERVLQLLRQPDGATLQALMEATGWQAHSIRGFISGSLSKGMGLKIESFKRDGERVYAVHS